VRLVSVGTGFQPAEIEEPNLLHRWNIDRKGLVLENPSVCVMVLRAADDDRWWRVSAWGAPRNGFIVRLPTNHCSDKDSRGTKGTHELEWANFGFPLHFGIGSRKKQNLF